MRTAIHAKNLLFNSAKMRITMGYRVVRFPLCVQRVAAAPLRTRRALVNAAAAASPTAAAPSSPQPQRPEGAPLPLQLDGLPLLRQEYVVGGGGGDAGDPSSSAATTTSTTTTKARRRRIAVVCPREPDDVLDRYIAAGLDGDPYWTRPWPSALALADELLQRPELVAGLRVADLGAGLGVAGIAAALAGAREVVLLDREPLALRCALMSAAATGVPGLTVVDDIANAAGPVPHAAPLVGSDGASGAASSSTYNSSSSSTSSDTSTTTKTTLSAAVYDWSNPPSLPRFDVVLACDVLYEADAVAPVARAVPALLKATSGRLLLADPPNRTAANRERFLDVLRGGGGGGASGGGASGGGSGGGGPLIVDEAYARACSVAQIDPEMSGGLRSEGSVPVALLSLRRALGGDTVGLKR